ncbi:hypothetical protein ARMSODRAFT_979739 [Armillaria solidipes]|uniref:Uncharacterized protein n=1 Tax=Armillaria solidipes TaxID=1076256 RepID=A0A2H3B1J1_9AGAR|nr:hypothetical protein ARMSODRAFT_979739 [Armillaria solidipes]
MSGHEAKYPFTEEQQVLIVEMLEKYAVELAKPDVAHSAMTEWKSVAVRKLMKRTAFADEVLPAGCTKQDRTKGLKRKLLNFKKDTAACEKHTNSSDISVESLTTALMAFAKPKTSKDLFAAVMNNYICQREDDECSDDEDEAMMDDDDDNEDEGQAEDDHRDQDDEDQDDFFEVDLGLVRKANCNPAGCYQHILARMWGSLTDEEREAKDEEVTKVDTDCDQNVKEFMLLMPKVLQHLCSPKGPLRGAEMLLFFTLKNPDVESGTMVGQIQMHPQHDSTNKFSNVNFEHANVDSYQSLTDLWARWSGLALIEGLADRTVKHKAGKHLFTVNLGSILPKDYASTVTQHLHQLSEVMQVVEFLQEQHNDPFVFGQQVPSPSPVQTPVPKSLPKSPILPLPVQTPPPKTLSKAPSPPPVQTPVPNSPSKSLIPPPLSPLLPKTPPKAPSPPPVQTPMPNSSPESPIPQPPTPLPPVQNPPLKLQLHRCKRALLHELLLNYWFWTMKIQLKRESQTYQARPWPTSRFQEEWAGGDGSDSLNTQQRKGGGEVIEVQWIN